MKKLNLKKGDNVLVLSGKDANKKGKILRILSKSNRVIVEGANIIKKHQRATQSFQGGIIERPNAMPISKVKLICPRCSKPSRISRSEGVRVCKKCGEAIDKA
ncbi:50S ribosomal protein L24 [Candidatus Saganbacteria bacterium]|nr:50S ribosomal protein L24 [Candidatus Saganbacteria bacterium]